MLDCDKKLEEAISAQRNNLTTDRLDMSYGEIISMYEKEEIIIAPQFQRLFRWDIEKRTKFIESILLGIPIPPIFVAEDKDGKWELVDGLQRISSLLSFFGILKNNSVDNNWIMESGSLIEELEEYTYSTLPEKYLRNIRRTYCRVEIIKWDSKYDMRYELFNRLNTGGAALTDQEIRNCIFRGISEDFNDLLKELASMESFQKIITLGTKRARELYDEELVLRFLALYFTELEDIDAKNISLFMTNFMRNTISNSSVDFQEAKLIFVRTTTVLSKLDNDIFKFSNKQLSTSLYEAIMTSIAKNIDKYESLEPEQLRSLIESFKINPEFKKYVGASASSKSRVVSRMKTAFKHFGNDL